MPDVTEQLRQIVSQGVGTPPPIEHLRLLEKRRRRRHVAPAALLAVASVLAVVLLITSVGSSHHRAYPPTTGVSHHAAVPPIYHPTASTPGSFFIVRGVGSSSVYAIEQVSTTGQVLRTLAAGPGLQYAENLNGLFESSNGFVYFLDLKEPSPPGPGIGIYRVPLTGGSPKLVEYGTDPALSSDGSLLAFSTAGVPNSTPQAGPRVWIKVITKGLQTDGSAVAGVLLASVFPQAGISKYVVVNVAWLPDSHRLAVLLAPPVLHAGASSCVDEDQPPGYKCPKPKLVAPKRYRLAVLNVPTGLTGTFSGRVVWAPADYQWTLMTPGIARDTLLMIGTHGTVSLTAAESVIEIDPMLRGASERAVGSVPAGCYPLALEPPSGELLCQPSNSATDLAIYRVTSTERSYTPLRYMQVLNAGW